MSRKGSRFDELFDAARNEPETEKKPTRAKGSDPEYQRTTIYLRKQIHRQLKAAAAMEGVEISEIIEQQVEAWLKARRLDI